jgi:aryl-alcohol dehydrogenase-like predicted oxidoreductase
VERRALGTSDLSLTPIGLGTWAIGGGDWVYGWGPQKDSDSLNTIRQAVEEGINWIDTAAAYGLGHAEIIVARALRDVARRERPYIFGKCGLDWDELGNVSQTLTPQSIRRQVEASLRRLEIDCFDLYQLGWPVWPNDPSRISAGSLESAWETMAALRREGKTRFIGLTNCDVDQVDRLHQIAPATSLQAPYSLRHREVEAHTFSFCERHQLGVIACSPMLAGLMTGRFTRQVIEALPHNDWRHRSPYFQEPSLSLARAKFERVRRIGGLIARTPAQVAIAWVVRNPDVTAASVGLRHPDQVAEAVGATSFTLSPEAITELEIAADPSACAE